MEQGRQHLYLFTNNRKHSLCLYRVRGPRVNYGHKPSPRLLNKPLLELAKSIYPEFMSFAKIGSRIFMVGGSVDGCNSNKVFIFDTLSSTVVPGPDLNSGKFSPLLFTFGSKIFAFSDLIISRDPSPPFEMWDTDSALDPEPKWSPLPLPLLQVSVETNCYSICGSAAVYVDGMPVIFISVGDAGTYAFEVDKLVWHYICAETLPINEGAVRIPHAPSMCCGYSSSSGSFTVFRFFYEGNGKGFGFKEIRVYGCKQFLPLGPTLEPERPLPIVFGRDNRVYFIITGVDRANKAYRYVKVYAVHFEGVSLKRRWMKEKVGGQQNDEVALTFYYQGQSSKSGKKKKEKKREMEVEENARKVFDHVNLSSLWGKCYGGRAASRIANVLGAIAM